MRHEGPSTIGVDTIYRSQGKIPEVFLRGAGLPDEFIDYIGSLVGRPIQFYSCFISYAGEDQEFAERLHDDLQAIKACAAGLRLTMLKPARSSTSRSTRPSACMTSCF